MRLEKSAGFAFVSNEKEVLGLLAPFVPQDFILFFYFFYFFSFMSEKDGLI
jgi:hypothetical protein